ncbi:MAG: outer membrane lipoprotein chaperone LolA [Steroidobacteraceae bacterium]
MLLQRQRRGLRTVLWAAAVAISAAGVAGAADSGGTPLDRYLDGLRSLRTVFTQTVTDAHGDRTETGTGTMEVVRPGKFRWDYRPSTGAAVKGSNSGQLLVADGKNLWFYDRELAQVSVKPMAAALSATPVMLLSGTPAELHDSFDISADGSHDGLDWVSVKPRSAEADFSHAELGFGHGRLERMLVNDRLGQTVQLDFTRSERNAHVDAAELQFTPPAGVDVIGTPQS